MGKGIWLWREWDEDQSTLAVSQQKRRGIIFVHRVKCELLSFPHHSFPSSSFPDQQPMPVALFGPFLAEEEICRGRFQLPDDKTMLPDLAWQQCRTVSWPPKGEFASMLLSNWFFPSFFNPASTQYWTGKHRTSLTFFVNQRLWDAHQA